MRIKQLIRYDWPLHVVLFLTNWLPDNVIFLRLRGYLASHFFKACGRDLRLGRNVSFYNPSNIVFGSNIYIAYGCWFSAGDRIEVEDEVLFGPYVCVASSNHTRRGESFRYGQPKLDAILVKKGAWIASHAVLTMGSIVGKGSVVAANSVVTGPIEDNCVYGGVPAKKIKKFED